MTFYKLWSGKILDSPESISKYFEEDVQYIIDILEHNNIDTKNLNEIKNSASDKIRNENISQLSDQEKHLITAVFIGDGEWNEPLELWTPFPLNELLEFSDSKVHKKWTNIARKYGKLDMVSMPNYSSPSQLDQNQKEQFENLSKIDRMALSAAILDLEWFRYEVKELNLGVNDRLMEKTRKETLEYFLENREEFSDECKPLRKALLERDVKWGRDIMNDYNMESKLMSSVMDEFESMAQDI